MGNELIAATNQLRIGPPAVALLLLANSILSVGWPAKDGNTETQRTQSFETHDSLCALCASVFQTDFRRQWKRMT